MDESDDNMSAEELKYLDSPSSVRIKSKKRSLVERELETNLTARVTSPIANGETRTTSRYGRARRLKTEVDSSDSEKSIPKTLKSPKFEKSPVRMQSPVYKMHASNSPLRMETPKRSPTIENKLETQIENIYNENISLSRFGSEEKKKVSPAKKFPKVYIRKDIIQCKEKEEVETITLIKNIFSPIKGNKPSSTHLGNVLERSSEKYSITTEQNNGYIDTPSVVKTLDFDGNKKKKKEVKECKMSLSKSDVFEMEAKCEYQVGDLVWARMGTYPFWPCIITRDPLCGTFVKRKLFGRIERDVLHVTFFGDNGRRGWIVDNMLRKFLGQLEFETTREQFTSEAKKRDPRLYASFFISEKKQSQWTVSVEEAEALLREPKRLRIDILRDMLEKSRTFKTTPKIEKGGEITRTNSDVSLSESLYDTLFSEDDTKNNDTERSKTKTRNKSLDVSEVVTACLDNMAAKTGITKIQRQSHMDRWLQKAKSKTPEKSFFKAHTVPKMGKELKSNNAKQKRSRSKEIRPKKSLSLRRNKNESLDEIESKLLSHQNEHDYSRLEYGQCDNNPIITDEVNHVEIDDCNKNLSIDELSPNIGLKSKVNNLHKEQNKTEDTQDVFFTVVNEELVVTKEESKQGDNLVQNEPYDTISESMISNDIEPMQIDLYDTEVQKTNLTKITLKSLPDNLENKDINVYNVGVYSMHQSNLVLDNSNLENMLKTKKGGNTSDMTIDSMLNAERCDKTNKSSSDLNDVSVDNENNFGMLAVQNPVNNTDDNFNETTYNNIELHGDKIEFPNYNTNQGLETDGTENILGSEDESTYNDEITCSSTLYNVINSKRPSQDSASTVSDHNDAFKESLVFQYDDVINNLLESGEIPSKLNKRFTRNNLPIDTEESSSISSTIESIDKDAEIATDGEPSNDTNSEGTETEHNFKSDTNIEKGNRESDTSTIRNLQDHDTLVNIKDIIKIKPVPIENSLSNCEMVCLPNLIKDNVLNVKVKSVMENELHELQLNKSSNIEENKVFFDKTKLDATLTNDNVKDYNAEESTFQKEVLEPESAGEITKSNGVDQNQLYRGICTKENNSIQAGEDSSNKETADNEEQSNRNSDVEEMESIDSDYTEELVSSNDPNSEFDPINDERKNENPNQKSSDNFTDSISMSSEISEVSEKKRTQRTNHKRIEKKPTLSLKQDFKDPEFLKYVELRQDALIDENPHLSQEEIISYLYNTWLYEESFKSERKKIDEIDHSNLVKGLTHAPVQPKRIRKKAKVKTEMYDNEELSVKSKSKRKIVRPYYNEDYSDIDTELEMFELFETRSNSAVKSDNGNLHHSPNDNAEIYNEGDLVSNGEYDQVEEYFDQLTRAKPHLFRGLIREKVCEICEKVGNLVKCKGCHFMFHIECTKIETDVIEAQTPTKGRKKKKRNRGRRQKNSEDSNGVDVGSQSDERSQDLNASEENISIDDVESESHLVVDAENLEAQLCTKMKEMFDVLENEYYSDSSESKLDWSDTEAGKCKIIDIKLPEKNRNRNGADYSDFKCNKCVENDTPVCFVCKSPTSPRDGVEYRQKCQVAHCHRYYHLKCLDHWPQTQFNSGEVSRNNKKIKGFFEPMTCPRHVCHTCVSDDPRGCKTRFSGDKLARCVRCPATYHSFTKCIPAGTQILTGSHIICPRHYEHRPGKVPCHVNTGWCFICALGGSLICCEYCPTSFHAECLNIKPPEGGYMCEDCETGRLPLYGEMVWVKLGHYRWWPGIILHPSEIPANILAVKHSPGEFVVRFFGQYDHYWVNRGRVFPFQEGDTGKVSSQKSKIDAAFSMAMEHAKRACEVLKNVTPNEEESLDIASSLMPPHYVKLKVNKPCGSLCGRRVDIEESSLTQCECNPDEEDPCGPYSQCLNRMLLTECGPTCRAGDRCMNRAFEKRLYPKLVPYRTPHRGWGLKTLEDIKAGQFVIEYVGELIDEEEFKRRMERKYEIRDENYYFLTLDKERMIDAGPKGNSARFMNHCCEPNCETQKWTVLGDVRVGLFATRDIPANSEVTFNYNLQCAGIEKKRCLCGAKRCSGYIGAKPKQTGPQPKKIKKDMTTKRTYKKRKNVEISPPVRAKAVKRTSRSKPRELTEIEKDLLIIKNATNGMSSDSDCSARVSFDSKEARALKRRRVVFSTDEAVYNETVSPTTKRIKIEDGD